MRVCPRCRSIYSRRTQFCGIDGERLEEQRDDPLIGHQVDRYQVLEKLGQGASGSVYRARHAELETDFAVKVLFGDLGSDETVVGRFRREAQTASKIRSPNVVSVVDFGTTPEGLTFLIMEYAEGRSLRSLLSKDAPFSPLRAARITAQIARGLAAAHRLGFVHRDIKPANIVIARENGQEVAKILDFGIVRINEQSEEATKLTERGLVVGTPSYMAPEQAQASDVTEAADLYALGVCLYEMLAGKKPFTGTSIPELVHKHTNVAPPPLPPCGGLEKLAFWLLAKKPEDRPEHAVMVVAEAERLQTLLSGAMTGYGSEQGVVDSKSPAGSAEEADGAEATPDPAPAGGVEPTDARLLHDTLGESRTSVAPAPKRSPLVAGAVLLLVAIVVGGLGFFQLSKEEPITAVPPPQKVDLRAKLEETLAARGLEPADLKMVPEAAALDVSSDADLPKLIRIAERAPVTPKLLRAKLDRLDSRVAGIPEEERGRYETRYLELYKQINVSRTPEGLADIARSISAFERDLDRR